MAEIALMSYLIRPDHPEGAGQGAQAAAGALLHIEGCALSNFMKRLGKTCQSAARFLAVVAKNWNRCLITNHVHIDVTTAIVHALTGHFA